MNLLKIFGMRGAPVIAAIALVVSSIYGGAAESVRVLRKRTNTKCPPIGRLVSSGDQHFAASSLLCEGDQLHSTDGLAIVECFDAKRVVTLTGNSVIDIANKCGEPPEKLLPCTPKNRKHCLELKGPLAVNNQVRILSPMEGALQEGRPDFTWSAIPGATRYTIELSGPLGASWLKTVTAPSLSYPASEEPMQNGNTYTITVVAYQGKTPTSAGVAVFNSLSQRARQEVAKQIEQVKSFNLDKDEAAAFDFNTIYLSHNLQDEAVKLLQSRIEAGTPDPAIFRTLGDRYLDANLPHLAKPMYKRAEALAASVNPRELVKARAGLEKISRIDSLKPTPN